MTETVAPASTDGGVDSFVTETKARIRLTDATDKASYFELEENVGQSSFARFEGYRFRASIDGEDWFLTGMDGAALFKWLSSRM